ncbi:MAG TPA: enoyl-CoA hydratase/isomerase family protein [Allosphingosinicella sp.]|nr:enoyl-CoA hydratase/isomerase family protein [Allosphingosinicella sp.]
MRDTAAQPSQVEGMFELQLREGGLARLRLARPEARNAIPADGWDSLAAHADQAVSRGARLLLVEGDRSAFCAGADLRDFEALRGDTRAAGDFRRAMRRGLDALAAVPVPVVAMVEGPCYGAGVALALACDIRLAGAGAAFAITPARMGISFPQEDVARLVATVGRGMAARLLFAGVSIDAREALRIGLADGLAEELDALCRAILENDADSIAALKRGIGLASAGGGSDPEQDRLFDLLLASEGLAARLAARRLR